MAGSGSLGGNIDIHSFFKTVVTGAPPSLSMSSSNFPPPPSGPLLPGGPGYPVPHPYTAQAHAAYQAYSHYPSDSGMAWASLPSSQGVSHAESLPGESHQEGLGGNLNGAHLMSLLAPQSSLQQALASPSSSAPSAGPSATPVSATEAQIDTSRTSLNERSLAELLGRSSSSSSGTVPPPALAPAVPSAPPVPVTLDSGPSSRSLAPSAGGFHKKSKGRALGGAHVVYDVDVRLPGEEQPQLEVAPITVYLSEILLAPGRQIAVNRRYICYALKTAAIRILNINTALRALLRGHSQRVTDMAFFGEDVHLLASASADGRVVARRLSEEMGEGRKMQIHEHLLFALQLQGPWGSNPVSPQVCWHPDSQDTLVVACQQYVLFISASKLNTEGGMPSFETPMLCHVDSPPPGVIVEARHQGPITFLMKWPSAVLHMPTPSQDGTVHIWRMGSYVCASSLVPHGGQPVYSAAFLLPPGGAYNNPVLLTGGPMNQELKLWAGGSKDPLSDWQCIQTLELQGEGGTDGAFFNQIHVVQEAGLILLANARKQAVYAIHVRFGSQPKEAQMDYLAEFAVTMPILSFTALMEPGADPPGRVQIYCVQDRAIQLYTLDLAACLPAEEEQPTATAARKDAEIAPDSLESPQLSPEPMPVELPPAIAALAKAQGSGGFGSPVETSHSSRRSTGDETSEAVSEPSVSGPADVAMLAEASSAVVEASVTARGEAVEVTRGEEEPVQAEETSGRSAVSETEAPPLAEASISAVEPITSAGGGGTVPCAPPLSMPLPSEDHQEEAAVSEPSVTSETTSVEEPGPQEASMAASLKLLTPAHFMSLVNSSQGEPCSVVSAVSASSIEPLPEGRAEDVGEDRVTGREIANSTVPEVSSAILAAGIPTPAEVDVAETEALPASSEPLASSEVPVSKEGEIGPTQSEDSDAAVSIAALPPVAREAEPASAMTESGSGQPGQAQAGAGPKGLDRASTPGVAPSPGAIASTSPVTNAISTKGRKNKNKATASVTASPPPAPPSSLGLTTGLQSAGGELGVGPAFAPGPSNGIPSGPSAAAVQESLNQLLGMQRELGSKLAMLVAVPVAKEGKRIEAALGTRLEKALKAQADAQWARLQEDAARREKAERERLQQTTAAVVAGLAKELQPLMERTVKKEVAQLAPAVARLMTPTLEAGLSSVTSDVLKSLGPQVESSIASQVETAVSRHVAAHLQSSVHTSMQEALRSCFQATVIPAFETACRGMFEQMDTTLQRGLGEHSSAVQQQLTAAHTAMAGPLKETMAVASTLVGQLREEMVEGQRKLLTLAEKAATSGVALPQGAGPAPSKPNGLPERVLSVQHVEETLDPTRELVRLLAEHKYEDAFNRALSLSDVAIVSWLCSQMDPNMVFSSGSVTLSQGVLLSLVQQLGCDLGRDTERKLLWLRNAVLALNPMHPQLAPHMRPILQQLYQNLHRQLPLSSDTAAIDMRLVIHVVNSLLTSCK